MKCTGSPAFTQSALSPGKRCHMVGNTSSSATASDDQTNLNDILLDDDDITEPGSSECTFDFSHAVASGISPSLKTPSVVDPSSNKLDNAGAVSTSSVNPFDSVLAAITVLLHMKDLFCNREMEERVNTVDLVRHLSSKPSLLSRLMHIAFHPSKPNLNNLALIDPSQFRFSQGHIVMGTSPTQSFFLVGQVAHSNLFTSNASKQICVKPLYTHWARTASAIAKILGVNAGAPLVFASYCGGISMSSYMKTSAEPSPSAIPVNGKKHGPAIRPWNENVPVFDCRSSFQLTKYHKCPLDSEDPAVGSFVALIFMLGRFRDGDAIVVSPNIQVVLCLGDMKDDVFGVEGTIEDTVPSMIETAGKDSDVDETTDFI
ncbi:hypothetical protein EDD18DRAFT_1352807 [Armillaria luteobubalina]|uniref:Uncharacterized protein n=1 Tax=Armillaria luteobubalina TaxID=153913 RepID=A0AA39Q635_9AGAR|nr:hypothetical protein EDD18DRAFT_1352807 [Armillaria luteobubalina]